MRTNMFSKAFKSLFFLLLFVGFSSFAQTPVAGARAADPVPFISCQHLSNTLGINSILSGNAAWGDAINGQLYMQTQWFANNCNTWPQTFAPSNKNAACLVQAVPQMNTRVCTTIPNTTYAQVQQCLYTERAKLCP